jgi:two-component system sensor histidine kinase BaeS
MIDDLQSLASAEAAALDLRLARCDLADIVASAIDSMSTRLASSGLAFSQSLRPAPVEGDAARLHQVTINLLSNAIKFTPPGGSVTVDVAAVGGFARLEVRDTGIGISEVDKQHVFERFWRGPNVSDVAGSGIGLSVVAELVRAHHGTVGIDSSGEVGTVVVVEIPLADGPL